MLTQTKKINFQLLLGWTVIVAVLAVAYIGEALKQTRTIEYVLLYIAVSTIPNIIGWFFYLKCPSAHKLRYIIVAGYFCMYLFTMMTGSVYLVFCYILPLLSFIILYHEPNLVLIVGAATLLINAVSIGHRFLTGNLTIANSKEAEIQIALLALCFGGCYIATRLYHSMNRENEEYIEILDKKNLQIQRMTMQTITTIANTIDAKDEYTKGHSQRVSVYAASIAKAMGFTEEEVRNIEYIALLHDLGKIGVPDAVLNKPGRLTDSEYELMKAHTTIGGEILKDIGMFHEIDAGAMFHHERYDGKGYPQGLKGQEIPLAARIIGIADAYDAMTSTRVYRKRLKNEDVLKEMQKCAGQQFDPEITKVFMELLKNNAIEQISPDLETEEASDHDLVEASHQLLQKVVDEQNKNNAKERDLDHLTAVYNRTAGERKIIASLNEKYGCLMMIDIDNMRELNSKYGILLGDRCLMIVGKIISTIVPNAIVARFGGDEFICLYEGVRTVQQAEQLAENILQSIAHDEELAEQLRQASHSDVLQSEQLDNQAASSVDRVSVSIGLALSVQEGQEYQHLLECVDKALYHIQQNGKHAYYLYQNLSRQDSKASCDLDLEHVISLARKIESKKQTSQYTGPIEIKQFIETAIRKKQETLGFVMFSIISDNDELISVEERDLIMDQLEQVVVTMTRQKGASKRYSSTQRIVVFVDAERGAIEITIKQILGEFYRKYAKKNISLEYSFALYQSNSIK